jgi:Stress responsive A/B Barrel Domain
VATRVIMIEFNPEATSAQMEVFEQELKAVADKIPYKKSFRCGFNRRLETEASLDRVAPEVGVHVPQFVAIWEFDSYDDLTRFVGESHHQKFASEVAKPVVRRRWVVNI